MFFLLVSIFKWDWRADPFWVVDTQNMTGLEVLVKALSGKMVCHFDITNELPRTTGPPALPSNYRSCIHHINVNTLPDLMVFIYTLPSFLDTHSNVSYFPRLSVVP
jgi:hypothetical protein